MLLVIGANLCHESTVLGAFTIVVLLIVCLLHEIYKVACEQTSNAGKLVTNMSVNVSCQLCQNSSHAPYDAKHSW